MDLHSTFLSLEPKRFVVVGDLMVDRYVYGSVNRVSPEAACCILNTARQEFRRGGAANVADALVHLGQHVAVVGVVGHDGAGKALIGSLGANADLATVMDETRPTTCKWRFIAIGRDRAPVQLLRVDREETVPLSPEVETGLLSVMPPHFENVDAVIISDYGKGVCTERIVQETVKLAGTVPVLVDPARGVHWSRYRGASVIKPNRFEWQEAVNNGGARETGALVAVTLDSEGIEVYATSGQHRSFPTEPCPALDVSGAGDVAMAVMAIGIANGLSVDETMELVNAACWLKVQDTCWSPITKERLADRLEGLGCELVRTKRSSDEAD